ncbi:histidine kinase [Clostridium botulinum]|nr:histidine kinase [Clostridium botulinum]
MILLVIFLVIIIIISFLYIVNLQRQMKNINKQIEIRIKEKSRQALNLELFDRNLNLLVANINKIFMVEENLRVEAIGHEEKLKDMIANISHDLRTPLTAVKGYIQLLYKTIINSREKEMTSIVLNHINELEQLINNFFELSYLEISKPDVKLKKINLTNMVSNSIVDYIYHFEEKNLQVEFKVENPIYVYGDEEKTKRIIQNLIKNCLSHSSGNVIVDIFNKDKSVILSFKNPILDTNEIYVENLFDKFYIAEKSQSRSTGLGLSIVKLLTEQMNGEVNAFLNENNLDIQIELNRYIN